MKHLVSIFFIFYLGTLKAQTHATILLNFQDCIKCRIVVNSLMDEFPQLKLCLNGANKTDINLISKQDPLIKNYRKRILLNKAYDRSLEGSLIIEEDGHILFKSSLFNDMNYLKANMRFYLNNTVAQKIKFKSAFYQPERAYFSSNYSVLTNATTLKIYVYNTDLTKEIKTISLNVIADSLNNFKQINYIKQKERSTFNTTNNHLQDSIINATISRRYTISNICLDSSNLYVTFCYYSLQKDDSSEAITIIRDHFLFIEDLTTGKTCFKFISYSDDKNPAFSDKIFVKEKTFYTTSINNVPPFLEGKISDSDSINLFASNVDFIPPHEIKSVFDNNFGNFWQSNNLVYYASFPTFFDISLGKTVTVNINDSLLYTPKSMQDLDLNKIRYRRLFVNEVFKTQDGFYTIIFCFNNKLFKGLIVNNKMVAIRPIFANMKANKVRFVESNGLIMIYALFGEKHIHVMKLSHE